jgi:hypothetical protein
MRWRVVNRVGAQGLPIEAWATAAEARLAQEEVVERADVAAEWAPDEVDFGEDLPELSIDVVVRGADALAVAALVEGAVVSALWDVVGDEEVGWSAMDWVALPAEDDRHLSG